MRNKDLRLRSSLVCSVYILIVKQEKLSPGAMRDILDLNRLIIGDAITRFSVYEVFALG